MPRSVYKHVTGMGDVSAFLDGLPKEMVATILAGAVDAGADIVVASAKMYARKSVRTGALYASIGKKTKNYKPTASAVSLVGPLRGYFKRGGRKVGQGESRQGSESPSHYAHLVEFGHATRQPKKGTSIRKGTALKAQAGKLQWVAPRPFMRPAAQATKRAVERKIAEQILSGIERVRKKMIKEGAHAA